MLLLPEKAGTEARRHRRGSVPALFGGTLGKFSEPYKLSACCALCHQSPDFFNVCIISEIVDQHSIYYKHKETRFLQSQGNWFPVHTGMFHDDSSIHSNSLSVETSFFQITVCMAHIERSHHDFATRSAYCSCKQCFCLYKNTFCVAKMLVGGVPQTPLICIFNAGCASLRDAFEDVNRHILRKNRFLFGVRVNGRI